MSFPRYPKYKDSGVEWLGEVPEHWDVKRLKHLAKDRVRNGIGAAADTDTEGFPRYVRITDIDTARTLRSDTFRSLPPDVAAEAPFTVGDILFACVGATFGKSYLHTADIGPVCYAGYLAKFSPKDLVEPAFVSYWTESNTYWGQLNANVIQSTVQNFSAAKYNDLLLAAPPTNEQAAIAAFLDRETAKIDALIAEQQRLIELLQEKRQAVISHAVTKGLNPDAPMKDSGIEWLGEVPENWAVAALRFRYTVQLGKMLDTNRITGEHLRPYLRVFDVQWGSINTEELPVMDFDSASRDRFRLVAGDLLVNEGGSYPGRSAVWQGELDECYFQKALHRLRPCNSHNDTTRFFFYVMAWATSQGVFTAGGNESTIEHLPAERFRKYRFAFPSLVEQLAISDFLDYELASFTTLTVEARRAITLLQERRAALISAAVTGQIDVRGFLSGGSEAA